MIDRFVAALCETELGLDWRDIADVLWLADVRARDAASESGESPADGRPGPAEPTAPPREAGGPATSDAADPSPAQAEPVGLQEVTPVRPAGWRLTERGDADSSDEAGLEVAAPTFYALPGGMEIGRALRPMKQQRRTPRHKVFDPEATVDLFCDTGVLAPVLRAGLERWFEVAVVADTSATMAVWDDTVAALADLLERHGAFRSVTRWALAERDRAIEVLSPSGLAHRPRELLDLTGRRLVLVVTDAIDALWARASIWEALRGWGEYGPVALVQVLPPRSWAQTRLGEADAAVAASRPGQPNHQLEVVPPWWWLEGQPPDHAVPVVGLDEASLSPWARMVMGAPGVSVPGVLAVPEDGMDGGASGQAGLPGEVDLERLGNVLRSTVSALAYRLAVLLSAVEVSLPIVRIVMRELMPQARLAHLAELIAAGVLKATRLSAPGAASAAAGVGVPPPAAAPGGRADRSQVILTFAPGLRELLQRSLTVTMTLQVWRAVAPYLEATHGLRRFSLLLQSPRAELDAAAGADELHEGLQAIAADLADRLGLVPSPAADWPPSSEPPTVGAAGDRASAPTAVPIPDRGTLPTSESGDGPRIVVELARLGEEVLIGLREPALGGEYQRWSSRERFADPAFSAPLTPDAARAAGQKLFNAISEHPDVRSQLSGALRASPGQRFPLYVQSRVPWVDGLPWEALCDPDGNFLGLDRRWPIGRIASKVRPIAVRGFTSPLRVVAVLSAAMASGVPQLQALLAALSTSAVAVNLHVISGEEAVIDAAIRSGVTAEAIAPNAPELARQITAANPNILHVLCHGGATAGISTLNFATAADFDAVVDGSIRLTVADMASALAQVDPWLAVLIAYDGSGVTDSPLVHELVSTGIPVAIGTRRPVDVASSDRFCAALYPELFGLLERALASGGPQSGAQRINWVDALTAPRILVAGLADGASWTEWVLYTQEAPFEVFVPSPQLSVTDQASLRSQIDVLRGSLANFDPATTPPGVIEEIQARIAELEATLYGGIRRDQ
jgi:hypothetical protein